jgi:hypothetical protein
VILVTSQRLSADECNRARVSQVLSKSALTRDSLRDAIQQAIAGAAPGNVS